MADIVLKDRNGNDVTYEGATALEIPTADGGTQTFTLGDVQEKTVYLDFSEGDMTIEPDEGKVLSKVDIPKPLTLVPENIKDGETVGGIKGTYKGAGVSDAVQSKAINFYDPFGELIYSYTRAEAAELTELPPGPELEGFTFEAWTRTLDEIQSEQFFCDVAPTYMKNGRSVTVLIIEISEYDLSTYFTYYYYASSSHAITVDWGDGTTNTYTSSSSYSHKGESYTHTYSTAGIYYISVYRSKGTSNICHLGSAYQTAYRSVIAEYGYSSNWNYIYQDFQLLAVLGNKNAYAYPSVVNGNQRLKIVGDNHSTTEDMFLSYNAFHCPALKALAVSHQNFFQDGSRSLQGCLSLERVRSYKCFSHPGSMYSYTYLGCDSLKRNVQQTANVSKVMNYNRELIFPYVTSVPTTISTDITSVKWGKEPIYVPDDLVEDFKASEIYGVVADCIRPISEYHDF